MSAVGPPWERPLRGRLQRLTIESEILRANPLGDPAVRPVYVYLPPGYRDAGSYPCIYVLQGMTGQVDMWLNRSAFEPTMIERIDELFCGDVPPALVAFVDAWTSYGGSQFLNSTATGRYLDYLCDEVVPFVDARFSTYAGRDGRAVTGKSSGGYGAMVVPMLRPDVFGALASHAGDALFEVCYLPEFPQTARILRDRFEGSFDIFFEKMRAAEAFDFSSFGHPLNAYAMAACYSPSESFPGEVILPFEIDTGRLIGGVWERWLERDPVRMVAGHVDELGSMRLIYVDAGRADEFYLDLGARAFSNELAAAGIDHTFELFDGRHGGIQHRYPKAIAALARALAD